MDGSGSHKIFIVFCEGDGRGRPWIPVGTTVVEPGVVVLVHFRTQHVVTAINGVLKARNFISSQNMECIQITATNNSNYVYFRFSSRRQEISNK